MAGRPKSSNRAWVEHTAVIDIIDLRQPTGYPDWLSSAPTVTLTSAHSGRRIETQLSLLRTYPHFGGVRYWFACPQCAQRVRTLYLTDSIPELACRKCHDLVYGLQYQKAIGYVVLHWGLAGCRRGGAKRATRAINAWASYREQGEEFRLTRVT